MALIISGILIMPTYMMLDQIMNVGTPVNNMRIIRAALAEHLRVYGRLPCPARMDADLSDADFDTEDCSITPVDGVLIGAVPADNLQTAMDCDDEPPMGPPDSDLVSSFRRNIKRVSDVISGSGEDNQKLAQTNCIRKRQMVDRYGNKILYAVTETATDPATLNPTGGQIEIVDRNNQPTTEREQLFVLVSFGENWMGATSAAGNTPPACGSYAGLDNENCDYAADAVFRDAFPNNLEGNDYYDDEIDFGLAGVMSEQELWRWRSSGASRDMALPNNARLIISNNPTGATIDVNDRIVINEGGILVDQTIDVDEAVYSDKFCYDDDCDGF